MYELEATHDYYSDSPNETSVGKIISFSPRHVDHQPPSDFLETACPDCEGYGLDGDDECETCEGLGTIDCALEDHPDVIAVMSYYEHGSCRWMVGPSVVPDYGNFDTANVAGVMVWNSTDSEREWFDSIGEEDRSRILNMVAEDYTNWANGEVYAYTLYETTECECCGSMKRGEIVDSCAGHLGADWFNSAITDMLEEHGIASSSVTVTGEADYAVHCI